MKARFSLMLVVKAAAAIAVVVLVVRERSLIASSLHVVAHAQWVWLVVAVLLEAVSMASFAGLQARLLRAGPTRVPFFVVMKNVYAAAALSAVLPVAGAQMSAGFVFRRLKRLGVDATLAAWVLVVAGVISSSASAFLLVAGGVVSGNEVAAAAGSVGGLIGAVLLSFALLAIRRPAALVAFSRPAGWTLRRVSSVLRRPIRDPDTVLRTVAERVAALHLPVRGWMTVGSAALLNWLADLGVLAASIVSVGAPVPWRGLLFAYGVGTVVATVGLVPGGLGVVEVALASTLMAAGVHHHLALAAVLIYRLISLWMVACVGGLVYLRLDRQDRGRPAPTAGEPPLRSLRQGKVDLDLASELPNLQTREGPRALGQLREQNVA